MLSELMVIFMFLIGGVPSIILTLSVPVIFGWKVYRKIRYGYTLYQQGVYSKMTKEYAKKEGSICLDVSTTFFLGYFHGRV